MIDINHKKQTRKKMIMFFITKQIIIDIVEEFNLEEKPTIVVSAILEGKR